MGAVKISDIIRVNKKREQSAVNLKVDADLYEKLKNKLRKENVTVHDFFVKIAEMYLSEK